MENIITVSIGGGFHNVAGIEIRWNRERGLSSGQFQRIQKHFCGMGDCTCGGALREFDMEGDIELKREFAEALREADMNTLA